MLKALKTLTAINVFDELSIAACILSNSFYFSKQLQLLKYYQSLLIVSRNQAYFSLRSTRALFRRAGEDCFAGKVVCAPPPPEENISPGMLAKRGPFVPRHLILP